MKKPQKKIFYISLTVSLLFILYGMIFPQQLTNFSENFLEIIYHKLGWLFLISVLLFIIFCTYIAFSKFGKIRLGDDSDRPEYKRITWIAMLFSAAIGISLVFYGVAEPVSHYIDPPEGEGSTSDAAATAMQFVYLHWGISAWACYALVGVCLAYFQFRKKLPATMSSTFYPILGEKVKGPIGKTIDVIAVLSIVIGVSTSLGFGTLQINTGLNIKWGIPDNHMTQLGIIAVVTIMYLWSTSTGIQRGIKYLSNVNIYLSFLLMAFIFFLGPTQSILKIFFQGVGDYMQNFLGMSFRTEPYGSGSWIAEWTLFYFAWWVAWSPLVGSFVARISKGRTIKEFMVGALFIPVVGSFFWFAVLGGSALDLIQNNGQDALANAVSNDITSSLFVFISYFPVSGIISVVAMVLIFSYFITSADSAIFVLGMISENGEQNPATSTKLIWGVVSATVTAILLFTGGLEGLQSSLVVMGLPLSIILLLMCYSMYKDLHSDTHVRIQSLNQTHKNHHKSTPEMNEKKHVSQQK